VTAPHVHALAIVRARDGRSILDRDPAGSEPQRRFAADPDRMHAAVTALGAHGVTVTGVGTTTLWLRGVQVAVGTACSTPLALATDGTTWTVADVTGAATADTAFDVVSGPLAGLLHHVVLIPPTTPNDDAVKPHPPAALPRDFLLGEVGTTLQDGVPPRFTTRQPFPAAPDRPADMFTATRASLRSWNALRPPVITAATPAAGPGRVTLAITERAGGRGFGDWFERLANGAPARGAWFGVLGAWATYEDIDSAQATEARVWDRVALQCETIDAAVEEITQATGPQAKARMLATERNLEPAARALHDWYVDRQARKAGFPPGWQDLDPASWTPREIGLFYDDVSMHQLEDAFRRLVGTRLGEHVQGWSTLARSWAREIRDDLDDTALSHGAASTYAALAVTGTAIDLALLIGGDYGAAKVRGLLDRATSRKRHVISMSWGNRFPNTAANWAAYRHRVAEILRHEDTDTTLLVASSGNITTPFPQLSSLMFAQIPTTLTVGGCTPAGAGWTASGRTHGYTLTDDWWPTGRATVPSVCAVTDSAGGGAVWHPVPTGPPTAGNPDRIARWAPGGGSSQAAPIVAAVCALVWTAFPDLTAEQVREAVVAGATPVRTGAFHAPPGLGPGFVSSSHTAAANPGSRRVLLGAALHAAQRLTATPVATTLLEHRR
jgi:hypothetical protein